MPSRIGTATFSSTITTGCVGAADRLWEHQRAVPLPERYRRLGLPARVPGHEPEPELLQDAGEHERHLHHREREPDATARATSERDIRVAVSRLHRLRREALRIETLGVVPEVAVAVREV